MNVQIFVLYIDEECCERHTLKKSKSRQSKSKFNESVADYMKHSSAHTHTHRNIFTSNGEQKSESNNKIERETRKRDREREKTLNGAQKEKKCVYKEVWSDLPQEEAKQ